jgi:predicted nucleic acid-binding protein
MASRAGAWSFGGRWRCIAPALLWSEVRSSLHEALWRREISPRSATVLRASFSTLGIVRDDPPELDELAWSIADELGLAKTYDAEFLALARFRDCLFVTADARLRRAGDRLGFVVDPVELETRR